LGWSQWNSCLFCFILVICYSQHSPSFSSDSWYLELTWPVL
jgi:hypothetical protein